MVLEGSGYCSAFDHYKTFVEPLIVCSLGELNFLLGDHYIHSDYSADLAEDCHPKDFGQVFCNPFVFLFVTEEGTKIIHEGGDDEGIDFVDKATRVKRTST